MNIKDEVTLIASKYFNHINNDLIGNYIIEQLSKPPLNPTNRKLQVSLVSLLATHYTQAVEHYNYNKYDFHEVYHFIHHDLSRWIPLFQSKNQAFLIKLLSIILSKHKSIKYVK